MNSSNIAKFDTKTIIQSLKDDKNVGTMIMDSLEELIENNSEDEILNFTAELLKLKETSLVLELNDRSQDQNFLGNLLECDSLSNILEDNDLLDYYLNIIPDDYDWEAAAELIDRSLNGADLDYYRKIFSNIINTKEHILITHIIEYWTNDMSNWNNTSDRDYRDINRRIEEAKLY